jgi:hypothetical protein
MSNPGVYEVSSTFGEIVVTVRGKVVEGVIRIGTAFANLAK